MGSLVCYWLLMSSNKKHHHSHGRGSTIILMIMVGMIMSSVAEAGNFNEDVDITWGGERAQIKDGGNIISLSLDRDSGSGFQSKTDYMFARIDMQLKLVSGDAAGTVTAYYWKKLSSQGPIHDEIDFEFLGNASGQPYTLHTNVYTHGRGNREQQFFLWFDPTRNFHTYSIVWKPQHIIIPIRVFKNLRKYGVPYPRKQPMKLYCSLWDAEDWATRGGLVKTDWSTAPFTSYFRNFQATPYTNFAHNGRGKFREVGGDSDLDPYARKRLRWVEKYFMVYNYCTDFNRFQTGLPPECKHSRV
ncbi:Xyloglucan endotransglucosylase/hydrolase 2 [Linum perenne]